MSQLERAKGKLDRIRSEKSEVSTRIRAEHAMIPFGQPNIRGRRDIYRDVNRLYDKGGKLYEEELKQIERIKMLESVEEFKEQNELIKDVHVVGKTVYATKGAKTSVNNLEYFYDKLKLLEQQNEEAKAYNKTKPAIKMKTLGTEITKLKKKIASLEIMKDKDNNKKVSECAQKLIDSGAVNQWLKKPIYYFVNGLRKVALELDNEANFIMSNRYTAYSEEDKHFLAELLKEEN